MKSQNLHSIVEMKPHSVIYVSAKVDNISIESDSYI
jgi:hypothetical protein